MGDLPDWTTGVDIVAQTITDLNVDIIAQTIGNLAVNIAAAAITLDVNIAAAAVTLNVNISSQTANLNVNLAASAITLNVNVAASAVTMDINIKTQAINLNIDIEAQSVGVHTEGEWAIVQGDMKVLKASGTNKARTESVSASYTVTAGKSWYITYFTGRCSSQLAADGDLNQMCLGYIWDTSSGEYYAYIGGNGGFNCSFPAPIKIPANSNVGIYIVNFANHNAILSVNAGGYEV